MCVNAVVGQKPYAHLFDEIHQTAALLNVASESRNLVDDDDRTLTGFHCVEQSAVLRPLGYSFCLPGHCFVGKNELRV